MEMGRNILNNDPEVTAQTVAGLSDGNKDFFRAGVARALKDRVDATQEGADATRKIFGNTLIRNKIAAGFGDDATFNQFRSTMENEGTYAQTRNAVLSGSRTAPLGADIKDVDYSAPLMLAAAGHPVAALASLSRAREGRPRSIPTRCAPRLPSCCLAAARVMTSLTRWEMCRTGSSPRGCACRPASQERSRQPSRPPRRQQGLLGQQ